MANLLTSRKLILDANGQATDKIIGAVLMVDTLSAGPSVDVTWIDAGGNDAGTVSAVLIGRKLHAGGTFSGYRLQGIAGATVTLLVGPDSSDAANMLTTSVVIGHVVCDPGSVAEIANLPANPVPIVQGTGVILDVKEKPADTLAASSVNVTDAAGGVVLLAASAARRSFTVRNAGANNIALIPVGGTYADAAQILLPGETWREVDAPAAAWNAICDAGLASTAKVLAKS